MTLDTVGVEKVERAAIAVRLVSLDFVGQTINTVDGWIRTVRWIE